MDTLKKKTSVFSLLDDAVENAVAAFDQEDLVQITKNQVQKKATLEKPAKQNLPAPLSREQQFAKTVKNSQPSQSLLTKRNGTKIFRERKSFKQLLSEYNGRSTSLAPLRSTQLGLTSQSGKILKQKAAEEFHSDRIESLEVPNINGKVLRPS